MSEQMDKPASTSRYRVVIEETVRRQRVFEAASPQDARELAEAEEWDTFELIEVSNAEIVEVNYVGRGEQPMRSER